MVNRLTAIFLLFIASALCHGQGDTMMSLTTLKGEEIILRPDNIWVPAKGQEILVEKDFTVPISGGRFVLINADGTWGFVKEELVYAEDLITTTKVVAKGTASNVDVTIATEAAKKKAFSAAVTKTKSAISKIKKIDYKRVEDCVLNVEKDVEQQENFKKGKGWTVIVMITLDKGSLLAVVDCARKKEEKKEE
jgi:hypothetical protein